MTDVPAVPPPATPPATPAAAAGKSPILSILSLVGGGLGILCCGFAGLFSIAGIVLGVLGRKREPNGQGLALAGIITGAVGLLIGFIWIVIAIVGGGLTAIPILALLPFLGTSSYYY